MGLRFLRGRLGQSQRGPGDLDLGAARSPGPAVRESAR